MVCHFESFPLSWDSKKDTAANRMADKSADSSMEKMTILEKCLFNSSGINPCMGGIALGIAGDQSQNAYFFPKVFATIKSITDAVVHVSKAGSLKRSCREPLLPYLQPVASKVNRLSDD